ncbi:hypothetical protein [Laceyella tengchongensis]|uniref:hypothetical protein n=1 Tax=Laceyella tengchongensis TaxID=574699 RepID=UPI0012B752C1|nr:hypothetical protein [Laceyella tengchongensis]
MTQHESQYDLIIIGTEPSDHESVRKLQESGKTAYYIQLTPNMITTLVSQSLTNRESSDEPSSASEHADADLKLTLHQTTLHTPTGETTTHTIHVARGEVKQEEEEISISYSEETAYQESAHYQTHPLEEDAEQADEEWEVLEAQEVEYASPYSFFQVTPPASTRKKGLRRKNRIPFQAEQEEKEEHAVYPVERIALEDDEPEQEQEAFSYSPWGEPSSMPNLFTPLAFEPDSAQQPDNDESKEEEPIQPIYRERDLKLRKRLAANKRIQYMDHDGPEQQDNGQQANQQPMGPFSFESQAPMHHSPFRESSSYRESVSYQESSSFQEATQGIQYEAKDTQSQPLEPFSSRRRNRQKKARFQQKIESLVDHRANKAPMQQNTASFWEEQPQQQTNHQSPFFAFEDGPLFENTQPTMQPFSRDSSQDEEPEMDASLKRDDIEFEDAYGGYNSWEEFLTPHSENSRKRQEMDKIEKRKLALRGLHSLINNLG